MAHLWERGGKNMLIKIFEDVFFITNRLKEIDENYFVVFNTQKKKFEVHSSKQKQSYCLTVPYKTLDQRTISLVLKTRKENFDKILKEIEEENAKIEKENKRKINAICEDKAKEIFSFAKSHEDANFDDAYKTRWASKEKKWKQNKLWN